LCCLLWFRISHDTSTEQKLHTIHLNSSTPLMQNKIHQYISNIPYVAIPVHSLSHFFLIESWSFLIPWYWSHLRNICKIYPSSSRCCFIIVCSSMLLVCCFSRFASFFYFSFRVNLLQNSIGLVMDFIFFFILSYFFITDSVLMSCFLSIFTALFNEFTE